MRSAIVVPAALAAALSLAGCGGSSLPSYEQSEACAIDTSTVTDVVGTDEIQVEERGSLPLGQSVAQVAPWTCSVDVADRDDVLSVTARPTSPADLAERTATMESAPVKIDVAGGRAGIDDQDGSFTAQWICDTTSLYVTAGPVEPTSDDSVTALVTQLAEAVGCPE